MIENVKSALYARALISSKICISCYWLVSLCSQPAAQYRLPRVVKFSLIFTFIYFILFYFILFYFILFYFILFFYFFIFFMSIGTHLTSEAIYSLAKQSWQADTPAANLCTVYHSYSVAPEYNPLGSPPPLLQSPPTRGHFPHPRE